MRDDNIARKVPFLDRHLNVGFVYSNVRLIDVTGAIIGGPWLPLPRADEVVAGRNCFQRLVLTGNFVCCPSVMLRRACLEQAGLFDPRLPFTADLEMWLRISSKFDAGYLSEPLVNYRVHGQQETQKFKRDGQEIIEVGRAIAIAFAEHLETPPPFLLRTRARMSLSLWGFRQARWRLRSGDAAQSIKYLQAATRVLVDGFPTAMN